MPEITIQSLDGSSFGAMASFPKTDQGPGLIIIHELFSNAAAVQAINDRYAAQGFVAVSPNLFHRQGVEQCGGPSTGPDFEQATRLYKSFDVEAGVRDLLAALAHVRTMPACSGKVGTVGYCLGCRMSYLMAARSDVDCAVGYYGVGIDSMLDEIYDIRMPFLLHLGDKDKLLQPSARQKILRAIERTPIIQAFVYEGAEHGFDREDGPTHHPVHAKEADTRTAAFLAENLLA